MFHPGNMRKRDIRGIAIRQKKKVNEKRILDKRINSNPGKTESKDDIQIEMTESNDDNPGKITDKFLRAKLDAITFSKETYTSGDPDSLEYFISVCPSSEQSHMFLNSVLNYSLPICAKRRLVREMVKKNWPTSSRTLYYAFLTANEDIVQQILSLRPDIPSYIGDAMESNIKWNDKDQKQACMHLILTATKKLNAKIKY
jgi:hypothetical protein